MSRPILPAVMVGNDFVLPRPQLRVATPLPAPILAPANIPVQAVAHQEFIPVSVTAQGESLQSLFGRLLDALHRYSLYVFIVLGLLVAISGTKVALVYWTAHVHSQPVAIFNAQPVTNTDFSKTVSRSGLQTALKKITNQPVTLTVSGQNVTVPAATISSWLQITPSANRLHDTISIKPDVITSSLGSLENQFVKAPVNQVTLTEDGVARTVVAGQDGVALADQTGLKQQIGAAALPLLGGSGLNFTTSTQPQAFAVVGPEAFDKLIVADVTTMQTYFFQNGQLVNQFPSSDGAPATPTPLGEFHIYAKYVSQDMKGYNPNGTKYFQPHVNWVNYFDGGDAVHGVYWHPLSWFGAHNSSHGCVGLSDDNAEWVYNWAPIGTTVITHA